MMWGMTLDPDTAAYLAELAEAGGTPYEDMSSAEEARATYRDVVKARRGDGPRRGSTCSVEEFQIDGRWYRLYRPLTRSVFEGPMPLVVFMHGGGWVIGDLETHDEFARAFASLPAVVLSVDYRLAPEHPFPAAHDDCWEAVEMAATMIEEKQVNADRIVVAGDSAGGLLAAAMAVRARDTAGAPAIAAQVAVDPAMDPAMDSTSHAERAEGYGLTASTMRWFYDAYAPGDGFSPLELEDLRDLPPAVVATAGYDLLADDGLTYARRLREAGVPTTDLHFPDLIHGFFGMAGRSRAAAGAVGAVVGALRGLLEE